MAKSPRRRIVDFAVRALPDAIEDDARRILGLEVKRAARAAPKALPAPPKPLALPAPGPGLPAFAVKPKGGQWWVDKGIGAMRQSDLGIKIAKLPDTDTWVVRGDGGGMKLFGSEDEARAYVDRVVSDANFNRSPENAARQIADDALRLAPDAEGPLSQLQSWFNKAAPKYIKNELGTADDPMRALAESGSLHVDLSPDQWSGYAKQVLKQETIGDVLGLNQLHIPEGALPTAGYDYGANVAINMPWLKKAPVTDKLYGIADTPTLRGMMGMGHLLDEMKNALDPRSGLPPELMLRPESLERMSLPAAAERVSLINQFRAKEMERAALDAQDNPVTHIFKEYAENNPKGLRWVEMAPPKGDGPTNYDIEEELGKALKYEGDTMGHCVGGYCPDVMEGRSRIFSLRDAKGEPHVTIETQPQNKDWAPVLHLRELGVFPDWQKYIVENPGLNATDPAVLEEFLRTRNLPPVNYDVEDIIQIKGKQNRKPKDEYLPFVRDFVKSGNWGRIGDEENSGLRRFRGELIPSEDYDAMLKDAYDWMRASPGGKAVREFYKTEMDGYGSPTYKEADNFINSTTVPVGNSLYSLNEVLNVLEDPGAWEPEIIESVLEGVDYLKNNPIEVPPIFKGFAVGGRVDPDRCFCRHPMAAK